jgi:AmmeMemoRadiSam system protein A
VIERDQQSLLLEVARQSIRDRLARVNATGPALDGWPSRLTGTGASFVTLTVNRGLRGCIGSIVASRPLVADVWNNARGAAFSDPRFPPFTEVEMSRAGLEVSVLSPLEPLTISSEAELLEVLRPGVDGLLLRFGAQRATFLPKVWESLGEPSEFLGQLKRKMGQSGDFWDPSLVAERYQTEEFSGPMIP